MITNKTFMKIAMLIAEASYCQRRKVGAVIVKDNSIISLGYNGTPSGFDNVCESSDGITLPEVLHAESNAITKVAKTTFSCEGATIYTTTMPCVECAKLIIQSGIKEVFYHEDYKVSDGVDLLNKAGIFVMKIDI